MSEGPIEFPVEGVSDGTITIRLVCDADLPKIVEACQDETVQQYTTVPSPYGHEDAQAFAERSSDLAASGRGIEAVVAGAETGEYLGAVGIRRHATDVGRWDIGYLVAPWARRRGVASAAARLICRYGFDELGAERIEICAEPENAASLGVAESAGFTREGVLRGYSVIKGKRRDMVMYSLLREELGELRSAHG